MAGKKGLGKGLDALFFDNATEVQNGSSELIKITAIEPNRNQPRKQFDDEALQQLADSIREHGLIQPLLVRPLDNGSYQIVAGERRWRASRMAGLTEIPVIIRDLDDVKTMELALIENLQRENLNAVEEALGYKELMENYNMTQAEVSKSVGKSRSAVANTIRLLNLPEKVLDYVKDGEISSGHARALLALEQDELIESAAEKIIKEGLTVRDIEKMAKQTEKTSGKPPVEAKPPKKDSFYDEMEIALKEELHRKVKITHNGDKGSIEIAFYNKQELSDIAERLARTKD